MIGQRRDIVDVEVSGNSWIRLTRQGRGRPVLLISGWPQSAHAWRFMVPKLVEAGREVWTLDPRGLGESDLSSGRHDLETAASDLETVWKLISGAEEADVVGHDVGAWITHAHLVRYPNRWRSATLVDASIPGLAAPAPSMGDDASLLRSWHFSFNRLHELPELLIAGREVAFLGWLFKSKSVQRTVFDDPAVKEYARLLARPKALSSGLEHYRHLGSPMGWALAVERAQGEVRDPMLTVAGEGGAGDILRVAFASHPTAEHVVLPDCGHYVPEEAPDALVATIFDFWARRT